MFDFDDARKKLDKWQVSDESREEHAEVHTPPELVEDMLDQIPEEKFHDPEATFLDPSAGWGDFGLEVAERLVDNGIDYKHALENQIYMIELQPKNARRIIDLFTDGERLDLDLNLKVCDALKLEVEKMKPEDWTLDEPHRWSFDFKRKEPKRGKPSVWRTIPDEIGRKRKNPVMEFQIHKDKLQSLCGYFRRNSDKFTVETSRVEDLINGVEYSPTYDIEIHRT
jgi:hypothetical protein